MNWNNLKQNKCPKCGKIFYSDSFLNPGIIECKTIGCDFKIREKRMSEIINNMVTEQIEENYFDDAEEDSKNYKSDNDY